MVLNLSATGRDYRQRMERITAMVIGEDVVRWALRGTELVETSSGSDTRT